MVAPCFDSTGHSTYHDHTCVSVSPGASSAIRPDVDLDASAAGVPTVEVGEEAKPIAPFFGHIGGLIGIGINLKINDGFNTSFLKSSLSGVGAGIFAANAIGRLVTGKTLAKWVLERTSLTQQQQFWAETAVDVGFAAMGGWWGIGMYAGFTGLGYVAGHYS